MIKVEDILFTAVTDVLSDAVINIPVKFPNRNGPEGAALWLEVVHIPNGPAREGWDDWKANQGLLNLGVHVTADTGNTEAGPIVDALLNGFKHATVFRDAAETMTVEIYAPPACGALIEDGQKSFYPVSIRYRSFDT